MIPPEVIEEINSTAKIEEVIDEFVNLKRRGVNMIGLCPFHNEKTPSFTVSPAKNLFKCFGCGKGGNSVHFLMEHEHFSYPEALKHLAQRYNIKIPEIERTDEQVQADQEKQSLLIINEYAQSYFIKSIFETDEGRSVGLSYFKHRGLLESTINEFKLGYSPKGRTQFTDQAQSDGYKIDKLKALGLVSQNGYDFYRERVIFPFHNISGKVIGFGGRILKDRAKAPKYLNSPESQVYNKRKTLYGLFQAKSEIRKLNQCILVEGYTDVLSLYQNGIKNVVASSGTSLTLEQVRLIKRFTENAVVLYDGDQAGQNAALRGLDIFLENNLNAKVVVLPENSDPDSFIQKVGTEAFKEFIDTNAQDFILKVAKNIQDTLSHDPVNKSIQIKELVSSIAKISDQLKRSLYIKECANLLEIAENALIKEVNRGVRNEIGKRTKENQRNRNPINYAQSEGEYYNKSISQDHSQETPSIKLDNEQYQERDLVRVLLQHGHKICDNHDDLTGVEYLSLLLGESYKEFKNDLYISVIEEGLANLKDGKTFTSDYFVNHENESIRMLAVNLLSDPNSYAKWEEKGVQLQTQRPIDENHEKDILQSVMRYFMKYFKDQNVLWKDKISECTDEDKKIILLTAYQKFKDEMREHATKLNTVII